MNWPQVTLVRFFPGIFVDSNIAHWKSSRKVINQVFGFKILKSYIKIFHEESIILIDKLWQYSSDNAKPFYPPEYLELATFNTVMRTTLGINPHAQNIQDRTFIEAVHDIFQVPKRLDFKCYKYNVAKPGSVSEKVLYSIVVIDFKILPICILLPRN